MVEKTEKLALCITGIEKHMIEKDLIKFLRKHFNAGASKTVDDKEE